MPANAPPSTTRARLAIAVRVLLGLAGLGVVAWLIDDVGIDALMEALVPALPWLPLAAALELARIGCDAWSTHFTLGAKRRDVPLVALFFAHLVAFAVMGVAPAGRATAEAVKASLLARWTGGGSAAAMGTANQANTLLSSGTFTLFCAAAAWHLSGASVLTWALLVHTVAMNASGLGLRIAARYERIGRALVRRFPRLGPHVESFHATSRETALFPVRPVGAMLLGRALQAAHFGILATAVGLEPGIVGSLAAHGVYLVVAAIGVLVPGQIGASEGGFAMSAEILGTTEARAMSIALLAHAVQLLWVGAGFLVLALWPSRAIAPKPGVAA